jgi:hypothetical protein
MVELYGKLNKGYEEVIAPGENTSLNTGKTGVLPEIDFSWIAEYHDTRDIQPTAASPK